MRTIAVITPITLAAAGPRGARRRPHRVDLGLSGVIRDQTTPLSPRSTGTRLGAGAGQRRCGHRAVGREAEHGGAVGRDAAVVAGVADGHAGSAGGQYAVPQVGDGLAGGEGPPHRPAVDGGGAGADGDLTLE